MEFTGDLEKNISFSLRFTAREKVRQLKEFILLKRGNIDNNGKNIFFFAALNKT